MTSESTVDQKYAYEKWNRSNYSSLTLIKSTMLEYIRGVIFEDKNVNAFLKEIANYYAVNEKVKTSCTLSKLALISYNEKGAYVSIF